MLRCDIGRDVLPRFMNRGLIEVRCSSVSSSLFAPLPRFLNRGLIEVIFVTSFRKKLWIALPRFMNRGLIEVRGIVSRLQLEYRTSPIHESGPH